MIGVWDTIVGLWKYTILPFLFWWAVVCSLLVLLSELEHRWIDPERVEFRASIWRLTAAFSLLFPLFVWLSPLVTEVSIPALRPVIVQFIRSWEPYPVELKTIPEGANRQIFDFGIPTTQWTISNPDWRLPKWPSFSRIADLSLPDSIVFCLAGIYWAGLSYFLVIQWHRRRLVHDFIWRTYPCDSLGIVDLIQEKAREYHIRKKIEVRLHDGAISPCAVGGRRIALILPREMVETWNPEEIEPILIHEFSHIRRRDFGFEWAALRLKSLLWFNPFAYWLAFRLEDTREALADADAAAHCQSPKHYASLLVRLAESIVYYPGIQFVHSFAAPGKKILRRLNRLSGVFNQVGQSFAPEGYFLRFTVWLFALFFIGGIHTAAPVIHMYSVIEPHPDTNAKALSYLREYRNWLATGEKGYVLSANLHQQYSAIDPHTGESLLAMDRTAHVNEWVKDSSYCKDLFGRHVLFPSLIPKQDQKPVWLAYRLVNSASGCFKIFERVNDLPDPPDDRKDELSDPFLQNKDFSNPSWNITRADQRKRSSDADFFYSLTNWFENPHTVIQRVESGDSIAALLSETNREKIAIAPAFGVGYRFVLTIAPDSQPFPSRIEVWDEDRLLDLKELSFSQDGKLQSLIHTRYQYWREDTINRCEYCINQLDWNPPDDSAIFAPRTPNSRISPGIVFPAREAEYFIHCPRTFDRERWTLTATPDFGEEAFAQGYFTVENHKDFYPLESIDSRKKGTRTPVSLYAPYERLGKITFQRFGNEIRGEHEIESNVLSVDFDGAGKMKTDPVYRKTIFRRFFRIDEPGIEPREFQDDRESKTFWEESDAPISCEEYERNSNQQFGQLGFLRQSPSNRFEIMAGVDGRLGESPKADLYLYNFGNRDIRIESVKGDPLVTVELPKDNQLTARSRTAIRLQAPAGAEERHYRITLKLDHPAVQQLDVNYSIYP